MSWYQLAAVRGVWGVVGGVLSVCVGVAILNYVAAMGFMLIFSYSVLSTFAAR